MPLSPALARVGRSSGAIWWLAVLASCARVLSPPGGPEDHVPPKLLGTRPESLAIIPDFHGEVEFRFDEVVSEGNNPNQGLGTGDLERQILLSPSNAVPVVDWKRSRIGVHPKEGWKPNRVYRVELLPGITDLYHNRRDSGTVITFTTGAPVPTAMLSGRVIDWVAGKIGAAAVIEAVFLPDSLVYRAVADSNGRFTLSPLPAGRYRVYAVNDQNKNLRLDRRENFDSVTAAVDSTALPDLWMAPHDTLGPKILAATQNDSVSVTLGFTQPLDPYQHFDSVAVSVNLLPDSVPKAVHSLLPKSVDDSVMAVLRAKADSIRAKDTTAIQAKPPVPVVLPPAAGPPGLRAVSRVDTAAARKALALRPPLFDKLVLRVDSALAPGKKYVIRLGGVRNVNKVPADAQITLAVPVPKPAPAPPDSAARKTAADSTSRPRADSTRTKP